MKKEETLEDSLKELYHVAASTLQMSKDGSLDDEMKGTMVSLIETHFKNIAKKLNYESVLVKEREERFAMVRQLNQNIRDLEEKLANATDTSGIREKLRNLSDTVYSWWESCGFAHVSEQKFTTSGVYLGELAVRLEDPAIHKPMLEAKGFVFANRFGRDEACMLLDTAHNRKLLINMIMERFPSAKVTSFKNRFCSKQDDYNYVIHYVGFTIYNLEDISK